MPDPQQAFLLMLRAGVILAAVAALPVLVIYLSLRPTQLLPSVRRFIAAAVQVIYLSLRPTQLLPRPSGRCIPWNGWAVLVSFILFLLPSVLQSLLDQFGFFQALYGSEFPSPPAANDPKTPLVEQAMHLRALWSGTIAVPGVIVLILLGLRYGTNASLAQIGLSRRRFGPNVIVGYIGWLVLTPIAFGVFMLAQSAVAPNPQKHPLMDLGPWAGRSELFVFALQAAILMPVFEELVFRGILLPWSIQRKTTEQAIVPPPYRPHLCFFIALLLSLQIPALKDALQGGHRQDVSSALAPTLFLMLLVPLYVLLPLSKRLRRRLRISSPLAMRGWLANAVLFASVHSSVWPSPIPLFFLGLGLAWLALRTQSIIPCIIVHGLFNGVAVTFVIMGGR